LPTQLVTAFRATLEEVLEATVLVHVRDISSPETEAQASDVRDVLKELGLKEATIDGAIEVYNKIDRLEADELAAVRNEAARNDNIVCVSALEETGVAAVLDAIERQLAAEDLSLDLELPFDDGEALAWLYANGSIKTRTDGETAANLTLSMSRKEAAQFEKRFGYNFT
jgi:GTP-binding protein HflX